MRRISVQKLLNRLRQTLANVASTLLDDAAQFVALNIRNQRLYHIDIFLGTQRIE